MNTRTGLFTVSGLLVMLLLSACAASGSSAAEGPAPSAGGGPIEGTWIDADVNGDTATIERAAVDELIDTHFSVRLPDRKLDFMAYLLGDSLYVRANACPPCRSIGFALDGATLVCDMCATTFDARTGAGIQGACEDYPKAAVPFTDVDGLITMSLQDLVRAYDDTLVKG